MIQQSNIKIALNSIITLDDGKLNLYLSNFENLFLQETEKYYLKDSKQDLSLIEYLLYLEKRFDEEQKRVLHYLDSSTQPKLIQTLSKVLIDDKVDFLLSNIETWLENESLDELTLIYKLFTKSETSLKQLYTKFEEYIEADGKLETQKDLESTSFTQSSLKIFKKYTNLIEKCFMKDPMFLYHRNNGCKKFINFGNEGKSSEILAEYFHLLLQPSSTLILDNNELESTISSTLVIYEYLSDKDLFHKFYSIYLSQRLIYQNQSNIENEAMSITKLKSLCSYDKFYKDQRMLSDVVQSKEYKNSFKKDDSIKIEFDVMILTSGSWPITPSPSNYIYPEIILKSCDLFSKFYSESHQGRKLNWIPSLSNGTLTTNISFKEFRNYDLHVSTYQMAILLLFNEQDTISIEAIVEKTNISLKDLGNPLLSLCKSKLLISEKQEMLNTKNLISLNFDFYSQSHKIGLFSHLQKKKLDNVSKFTLEQVTEERKYILQATIIRILKERKRLDHNTLVSLILKQVSIFTPQIMDIKKSIDALIEKEYIKRDDTTANVYHYI